MPGNTDNSRDTSIATEIARGVARLLRNMDADCLFEFKLRTRRRADVIGLGPDGAFTIVEIKSSIADFRADGKWPDYTGFCDRFYFAVPPEFPVRILPEGCGVMFADGYGGEIVRPAPEMSMNPARRRALTLLFARTAATRLMRMADRRMIAGL
ncbi:MAG: MmcB family DNA repair protein [Alphaproteobacteria bacterium]